MKDVGKILILGAGPTGLGAAWRLRELGYEDYQVIEQADQAGGLASSFQDDKGFWWDVGGHVQFSHYRYFDRVMDEVVPEWLEHDRSSWIWMEDRFVPYPLQQNLHHLRRETQFQVLSGLARRKDGPTATFRDWIMRNFGDGLSECFMEPYNEKVWAWPTSTMSSRWVGERVAPVDLGEVLKTVFSGQDQANWGPNKTFRFPKRGGTGQIWRSAAANLPVWYGQQVQEVRCDSRTAVTTAGTEHRFDRLLSTLPLDLLLGLLSPSCPVLTHPLDLVHSSTNIVGVGLRGDPPEHVKDKNWMYFPEANCPFYRVTVFSNYSPLNVPSGCWSLMAEISESPHRPRLESVAEETVQGMLRTNLIQDRQAIESIWTRRVEHGYPTPTLHRDRTLNELMPKLEDYRISSRGRFGAWKYEVSNQDHSFMQGVEWVNRVLLDVPETTWRFPDTANGGWGT